MDLETLQRKYDRLINAVQNMRGRQKAYFKHRASVDLDKAKYYERRVDALLEEEKKYKDTKQKELF